ncbi:MAG: 2-C-methyl-D-erythritol 2,4-cyclodiphosphate synthase [bacterium]
MNRVGFGYDIHPLVEKRKLILGGVIIPFPKGLEGHSDADVVCHAIADALLGAAAKGDIGEHFPDTDEQYKDASSINLLKKTGGMVRSAGFNINNIDVTVIAEEPKIFPYKLQIIKNIAQTLELKHNQISIKATTHEGLGELGRGEAIAAQAVVMVEG